MIKKLSLMMMLTLLTTHGLAETCPSVADVKNNHITGWKILDSEEDIPLSADREAYFKSHVAKFSLAEWTDHHQKKGTIHCYYHDINGSDFEAYLVKDSFEPPRDGKNYWYQVTGSMHCAAGTQQCEFQRLLPPTQLAKR